MKKILGILLSIISIIGFSANINAASPSSITTNATSTTKFEYVEGIEIYKNYASSYNLFVLNSGTNYENRITLTDPVVANNGFAYIINNMNVTSSSDKNYYIAQVAILIYQDYLNGNDKNISSSLKTKITNNTSDTVCYYINKLVNGAKSHNENDSSIKFLDKEVSFTKSGSYYYSNVIGVETDNLRSTPSIKLKNAPSSATVINNTLTKDGEGSFQIRIPASSMSNYDEDDFLIEITGSGYDNTVYKYTRYGADPAIYGRVYSNSSYNEEASIIAKLNNIAKTNVRISVLDEDGNYISGLRYEIYSGDCTNKTCYNNNLVESFTTNYTYKTLSNILSEGTYTLVNKSNYEYYNLPEKKVFNVADTTNTQQIIIESNDYYNDDYYEDNYYEDDYYEDNNYVKKEITIYNIKENKGRTIYIKGDNDKIIDSYKETGTYHKVSLYPGSYCILASDNSLELFFEITESGKLFVHENGININRNSIDLNNYYINTSVQKPTIEDTKEEEKEQIKEETNENVNNEEIKENITYDENGNIHIDNLDNVESIDIENKVETKTEVKVEWLSNIVDCPITSLSSTIKYVIGAIILSIGACLVVKNVKKSKNNI